MQTVRLALNAMATRFELVIHGEDTVLLRAAGEEALSEINRLDERLSFYNPTSEISYVNDYASKYPVQVTPELYSLLKMASGLYDKTYGAFDVTVGPLMRCWGFVRGSGAWPKESTREKALQKTGMDQVLLDDKEYTVAFTQNGMAIDLGAIGKGYAIQRAADLLRECGIMSALLHGGTSTVAAIGTSSPGEQGWTIGVVDPLDESNILTSTTVCNEALSVSAPHGKAFKKGNQMWGHVIDPRVGYPVQGAAVAAVTHSSATVCDAVSTALLVMNRTEIGQMAQKFQDIRILCGYSDGNELNFISSGFNSVNATVLNDEKYG